MVIAIVRVRVIVIVIVIVPVIVKKEKIYKSRPSFNEQMGSIPTRSDRMTSLVRLFEAS